MYKTLGLDTQTNFPVQTRVVLTESSKTILTSPIVY